MIGQDGAVVPVRHVGSHVRVHQCRYNYIKHSRDECPNAFLRMSAGELRARIEG